MFARGLTLLLVTGIVAGTSWGDVPDRLAPAKHTRPGAARPGTARPTTPATRPPPGAAICPKHRPTPRPQHDMRRGDRSRDSTMEYRGHHAERRGTRLPYITPPPRTWTPRTHTRPVAIPRSFADVFGGAFAGSAGPSGKVQVRDGAGRPRRLGSFRSLSATEIEVALSDGFLLRIILQDFDPATGLALADTYTVDTNGQPKNSRVWSYRTSGRMQLPVGASPPRGDLQTRWTNIAHSLPGGGVSIATPTMPTTLFFVP